MVMPSAERPPPPYAAAEASLRPAEALLTPLLYGAAGWCRRELRGSGHAAPRLAGVQYVNSLLDLIGNTPLLRLSRSLAPELEVGEGGPLVLGKIEYLNPGGSVKDRIATRMIEAAEASGELQPGGTIVEPTSGNTGVGLAMVAQAKGYQCVFVCPDKVSEDKRNVLKAYGAEVVVCPTAVDPDHPDSYYSVSDRLSSQPGAWKPDQYSNPHNPRSHYETTGPEIWQQTEGRITHLVVGVGTGGTISGIGRYLKEQNPDVQVIGADPAGSVYSGGSGRPYLVEGVGEDFWPECYDRDDRRPDHRGLRRRLVRVHPAAGPRGGAAGRRLVRDGGVRREAAGRRARRHPRGRERRDRGAAARLRPRLPHQGLQRRLAGAVRLRRRRHSPATCRRVGQVLRGKDGRLPDLVHTHPGETIAEAVQILQEYGVSQMPVVRAEPPIVAAEVAGSVSERDPARRALRRHPPVSPTRSSSTCPSRCRRSARASPPATP